MMDFPADRFREALIEKMDMVGITAAELSRRTGVSKAQIDKLRQRKTEVTNVNDAIRLALFFGQPIEDFMGLTKRGTKQQEIIEKLGLLPPEVRDVFVVSINAMVAQHMKKKG